MWLAVANDQGARAREVAQGLDRALRSAFLEQRQRQRDQHEAEERQTLAQIAECKIEPACGEQQQEHRLAHRLDGDRDQGTSFAARQRVRAVFGEAPRRLGTGKSRVDRWGGCG